MEEDKADYLSALSAKIKNKKWKTHQQLKKNWVCNTPGLAAVCIAHSV